ncbi:CDP-alcohol phosphatidyltransferase family protein [Chondromyces crocatus]|uniref:CDP-alcohol phosphatidyltransferase n=1 Tax=Chondromyces crocatus TaxID=52 RepID=A0A0K1EHR1_CHOCO|nr:CDP-alcohol phosphatidyltransferase family protein [Chondromyces crocatus]AKT40395.1 uncharacterized protein CMC5_045480 [Chondromyces crocatus]
MVLFSCALAFLFCTAILCSYRIRLALAGRPDMPRLGASPGSALLPGWIVEAFYWSFHAPARALVRLRVDPDALTYLSLVFSIASAPLLALGHFELAAAILIAGAVLDALDGMVARARACASPAGAVLDSCVDRVSDAAPLAGLALYYRETLPALTITLIAIVASSLVSYARAKADIYRLTLPNGLMRRHERLVYLIAALIVGPLWPTLAITGPLPYPVILGVVALIGGVSLIAGSTLVHRTRVALAPLARGAAVTPGIPGPSPDPQPLPGPDPVPVPDPSPIPNPAPEPDPAPIPSSIPTHTATLLPSPPVPGLPSLSARLPNALRLDVAPPSSKTAPRLVPPPSSRSARATRLATRRLPLSPQPCATTTHLNANRVRGRIQTTT